MTAPAGPRVGRWGAQGVGWASAWALGPEEGAQGDSWIWSTPPSPGTLVTMETHSCLGGFGCLLPFPTPQPICGGGRGPGGVWGWGLPHPTPRASLFTKRNLPGL